MFFWNKYCGLAFFFISINSNLLAQKLDNYKLTARIFLLKNISLTDERNGNIFLDDGWRFIQRDYSIPGKSLLSLSFISPADVAKTPKNADLLIHHRTSNNLIAFNLLQADSETQLTRIIPSDFSTCRYGFFCKQEMKIEKAINLPLRVRLGSLQQCNYYEGKP
ncbi:MAG: hypothetical protein ABI325_00180 [Ginsengibacter sp.]